MEDEVGEGGVEGVEDGERRDRFSDVRVVSATATAALGVPIHFFAGVEGPSGPLLRSRPKPLPPARAARVPKADEDEGDPKPKPNDDGREAEVNGREDGGC